MGGSGGAPAFKAATAEGGGGAGGGAILIAANDTIAVRGNGILNANGGRGGTGHRCFHDLNSGGGSGGAIRLVADGIVIEGGALVTALGGPQFSSGGAGGAGRIRLDANTFSISGAPSPAPTSGFPEMVFPEPGTPIVRATMLGGNLISMDPANGFLANDAELDIVAGQPLPLTIEAFNVPTTSTVTVRVSPQAANAFTVGASFVDGDEVMSTWVTPSLSLAPGGAFAIQVRADLP